MAVWMQKKATYLARQKRYHAIKALEWISLNHEGMTSKIGFLLC